MFLSTEHDTPCNASNNANDWLSINHLDVDSDEDGAGRTCGNITVCNIQISYSRSNKSMIGNSMRV